MAKIKDQLEQELREKNLDIDTGITRKDEFGDDDDEKRLDEIESRCLPDYDREPNYQPFNF
jgi:hypothetical protein